MFKIICKEKQISFLWISLRYKLLQNALEWHMGSVSWGSQSKKSILKWCNVWYSPTGTQVSHKKNQLCIKSTLNALVTETAESAHQHYNLDYITFQLSYGLLYLICDFYNKMTFLIILIIKFVTKNILKDSTVMYNSLNLKLVRIKTQDLVMHCIYVLG